MSYIKRFLEEKTEELATRYNLKDELVMFLLVEIGDTDKVEKICKEISIMREP